jgi:hypothetical protein
VFSFVARSMSNDCGCGPMSLILSAVLPMTDLLKMRRCAIAHGHRECVVYRDDNIAASSDGG